MITYYKEAFRVLLDQFALKVKQGKYKKLDYNLWRKLYAVAKENKKVVIEYKTKSSIIQISWWEKHSNNEYKKRWVNLKSNDSSLGRYLADELYNSNLQPKVDEYGTITFDACVFGEPNANKTVIGYDSIDLDNIAIKDDLDALKIGTIASGTGIAYGGDVVWDTIPTMSDLTITRDRVEELGKMVQDYVNKDNIIKERKENEEMKGFNFDFGSCEGSNVRMSMYGLAVMNASGTWVSYDPTTKAIIDVDILNFDGAKYMYKLPVAIKDIAPGDVIVHARKPLFVTEVVKEKLIAVDPFAGEEKIVLPTHNCFGFDFATKIVCLFDNMFSANPPSESNPFGNMWMFMLNEDIFSSDNLLPLMMMMNGGKADFNPMMLLLMQENNKDILPLMMMMNQGCHCGCSKDKND